MSIMVKNSGAEFQKPKAGTVQGVCYAVADIGFQETPWGKKHQLILVFEINQTMNGGDFDGKRFVVSKKYNASLHPDANLGKDLNSWINKQFAENEQFDIESLVGKNCLLVLKNNKSKNGKEYINIVGITPLMEGMKEMIPENKKIPEWVIKMQNNTIEDIAKQEFSGKEVSTKDIDFDDAPDALDKEVPF